ncbi:MAG: hypothetical protein H0X29_08960 [Parachlamydiaceae bacterium]|nr:hypothetical protein [Parachlamydiaceae bacterium]
MYKGLKELGTKGITPLCQWIEARRHETEKQSVGNCAWESVETATYAAMLPSFLPRGEEFKIYEKEFLERAGAQAFELFDSWHQFVKLKTIQANAQEVT